MDNNSELKKNQVGCAGSSLLSGAFSSCGELGLLCSYSDRLLVAIVSLFVEHGLSCSTACGIFPDQGLNPLSPAFQGGFPSTGLPGELPDPHCK